jgi:hypothetical protein
LCHFVLDGVGSKGYKATGLCKACSAGMTFQKANAQTFLKVFEPCARSPKGKVGLVGRLGNGACSCDRKKKTKALKVKTKWVHGA